MSAQPNAIREQNMKVRLEDANMKSGSPREPPAKSISIRTSNVAKFTSQTSAGKLTNLSSGHSSKPTMITARVTRPPGSGSPGIQEGPGLNSASDAARRAKQLRVALPKAVSGREGSPKVRGNSPKPQSSLQHINSTRGSKPASNYS